MFVLRIATYVLTSLASLVFLAMVLYGYLALQDLRSSLSGNPLFGGSSFTTPQAPTSGLPEVCLTRPDDPSCANY